MRLSMLVILVFLGAATLACGKETEGGTAAASGGPKSAAVALDDDLTMHPGEGDRCPVCAMTTHDKKLPAAIALKDGRTFYFCGPGCMIRSWLDPKQHLGVDKSALGRAVATEFITGKSIDAGKAVWIWGSDVAGPMGPMPVPLAAENVEAFKTRHGGAVTFSLDGMTTEKWQALKKGSGK